MVQPDHGGEAAVPEPRLGLGLERLVDHVLGVVEAVGGALCCVV